VLQADTHDIDASVREVRFGILRVFVVALAVTTLLSIYLAGTIARPVRHLAEAAEQVRSRRARIVTIPDLRVRRDEIGDLSAALRDMTRDLYERLDAIEAFAADVAHEIRNPLTSLRSGVEAFAQTKDPEQRQRLGDILKDDIRRIDRLITEIRAASRVDAEVARAELVAVDVAHMLTTMVEAYRATTQPRDPALVLSYDPSQPFIVHGLADRLAETIENLVSNARSFSPEGAAIRIVLTRDAGQVRVAVEDEGPGLPEESLERIFARFYSERPAGTGEHSGLGLSIARRIVEGHGGTIRAENRRTPDGAVIGARFVVTLPA
ncbi:MAG: HAMP domain-containing protein, partial [Alphaproteobacteria bacterium]|nr:HAMP domain-containing protein [Alphaproteobacteria bacterium]